MKKHEDATDYFNRVRRRELGGETFDGNGNVTFRGSAELASHAMVA